MAKTERNAVALGHPSIPTTHAMPAAPWPDIVLWRLGLAIGLAWLLVAIFLAAIRAWPGASAWWVASTILGLAAASLLIPSGYPGTRALSVFLCFDAILRVVDVSRRAQRTTQAGVMQTLPFFCPFPVLLVTGEERTASERLTSSKGPAIARTLTGAALFLVAWAILFRCQTSHLLRTNFALDHVVKALLFAATLEILGLFIRGAERLAGFDTKPLMVRILASRTPAEFWRRYNTRVHTWMIRNIYRRVGGAHYPERAIALVFLVSAVFHETAFDIALGRIDGSQFVFFLLQMPAVFASPALERFAERNVWTRVTAHVVTIGWFLATSVLFFRGIGEIFPFFYTAPLPAPLFGEWRPGA